MTPRGRLRTLDAVRRALVADVLDRVEWRTTSDCENALRRQGTPADFFRVALVLERLANDGEVELERGPGRVRRFRLAACREKLAEPVPEPELQPVEPEPRDLAGDLERLFADGVWRTRNELVPAVGARPAAILEALATPARFVRIDGTRIEGRRRTARLYGTRAMLEALERPAPSLRIVRSDEEPPA